MSVSATTSSIFDAAKTLVVAGFTQQTQLAVGSTNFPAFVPFRNAYLSGLGNVSFYSYDRPLIMDGITRQWQNLLFRMGKDPRKPPELRKKVVVLGTGWAAINFIQRLDVSKYDVTIVSPRNYFTFTPLLPSVCAGTLSARACLEPVRNKMLRGGKNVMTLHEAWATDLDATKKSIKCRTPKGNSFQLPYDFLVIAVGAEPNTFGIPGVQENAYFLKELENASAIHRKLIDNFELASLPTTNEEEKRRLLHFIIVGGGPTGVETAAEISDFVKEDAKVHFPDLLQYVKVSLVEMLPKVLPMFSQEVSQFTLDNMKKLKIDALLQCRVTKITKDAISVVDKNNESQDIPYGFVLWASGVGQVPFVKKILASVLPKPGNRFMCVNENLQVIGLPSVYAMGDCTLLTPQPLHANTDKFYETANASPKGAGTYWLEQNVSRLSERYPQISPNNLNIKSLPEANNLSKTEFKKLLEKIDSSFKPPPPTAQAANQEARYLASIFNRYIEQDEKAIAPSYIYRWKGSMAYVGDGQSVIQTPDIGTWLGGRLTNLMWKSFYWGEQMSCTNKLICIFDWCRVIFRGRDVGRDHSKPAVPPTVE